jgi:hypothetical protein
MVKGVCRAELGILGLGCKEKGFKSLSLVYAFPHYGIDQKL